MSARDDSLRIDATGTAHPLGREASAEMRARAGEWRVLPGPTEVVLLIPSEGRRRVRWAGEVLSKGALSDVFTLASQAGWYGELVLIAEEGTRSIFFDGGNVVASLTNVAQERLGEILFQAGVIPSREDLEAILKACDESGRRLGEMAIDLGLVTSEALFPLMNRQIEEVFFGALRAEAGTFFFFDGFDEGRIKGRRFSLNTGGLLMEAARRMDELAFFRERVPNSTYIPSQVVGLKLPEESLMNVYDACDGERSIEDIGRELGILEFELTKAIYQLVAGSFIKLSPSRPRGPEAIVAAINPILAMIHQACEQVGRCDELRVGLARFATGGGVYDPLFQGAGPSLDGSFRSDRVAKNIVALAGADQDAWLLQLMEDYVGFALFQTESLLPKEEQRALAAKVTSAMQPLLGFSESPTAQRSRPALLDESW